MKITNVHQTGIAGRMAGHAPASGVTVVDSGGYYTADDLEDILAEIGAGLSPAAFYLRRFGGGSDTEVLTAAPAVTADLANASVFLIELDQDVTLTVTGFLPAGRRSEFAFQVTQDGTGGHTPTFAGFTWIGGTPAWDTTAGTVTHVVAFSSDGGTTIYGAVVGGGSSALTWVPMTVFDPTIGNYLPLVDGAGNQVMAMV